MNLMDLTKKLINIPSITGSEAAIADFLSGYLRSQSYEVMEQKIEGERRNILALLRPNPRIMFCTHLDTVPPFMAVREDETYIYGRGACDAKGIMASMIWAGQELGKEGLADIGLLFVVGEETDSIGAIKANDLNMGSEFIVVGEPTENKMGFGHKGLVIIKMTASGRSAHSAFPHLGESAIDKLIESLQEIRFLDFGEDPTWGKTLVNVGKIEGGIAHNVIPDSAGALVSLRSGQPSGRIIDKIKSAVGSKVGVEILSQSEPQALFTLPGFEQVVLPYGTDLPYLNTFGRKLLLGPGSALFAHTENDKIEKVQLFAAVEIYKELAKRLLTP
jgi:acetylornithine deacetylase